MKAKQYRKANMAETRREDRRMASGQNGVILEERRRSSGTPTLGVTSPSSIGHIVIGDACVRGVAGLAHILQSRRLSGLLMGDQMPISDFEFWFQAIRRNDHYFVNQLLSSNPGEDRQLLLNGRFVYEAEPQTIDASTTHKLPCAFERPLLLAAVFRSVEVLAEMLHFGANIFVQDNDSSTIIHGIIWADALKPQDGTLYLDTYTQLMSRLSADERRQLLFMENSDRLRPLELSARLCTFDLFQRILDTEGVYVYNKGWLGGHMCSWYDVTDYESYSLGRRMDRSPLKMLTVIEKEHVAMVNSSKLTRHHAIDRWIHAKVMMNLPYLSLWFLVRLFYASMIFISFQAQEENVEEMSPVIPPGNSTRCGKPLLVLPSTTYNVVMWITVTTSILFIIFDIIEVIMFHFYQSWSYARCYHDYGSRHFVVKTRFYRICNFTVAVVVIVYFFTRYLKFKFIYVKAFMIGNIVNIWTLLFFIQFVPALGYFVTIIKRMLKDLFNFLVIYVILFFSFSQTFHSIFNHIYKLCSDDFSAAGWSMYSTFRIMLNMVNLSQYELVDVALLHVAYVIVVSILLINFLIALMSNSVAEVAENRSFVMLLQRLSAALLVERRLVKLLKRLFKWQQGHYFVRENGRVYIECFILKDQS